MPLLGNAVIEQCRYWAMLFLSHYWAMPLCIKLYHYWAMPLLGNTIIEQRHYCAMPLLSNAIIGQRYY